MKNPSAKQKKIVMRATFDLSGYAAPNGFTMKREDGFSSCGVPLDGKWVMRNSSGEFIDCDAYRSDLCERNGFDIFEIPVGRD